MPTLLSILLSIASLLGASPVPQQAVPRAQIQNPHGNLNLACNNCHTYTSWKPIRSLPEFDHNKTRYPLRGMHVNVNCMQCHTKLVFSNVGMKCADCHADFHRHQFGAACEQCHTVKGWRVDVFAIQHHDGRFPILGAHAAVQCESCHKQAAAGTFVGLSADCYSCHAHDFQAASFNHKAMGFPPNCNACHSMDSWLGAKFDHAKFAGFALTGMHATLACTACHVNGRFQGTPADCFSCHAKDFNQTTNPNHVQAGFPHDCGTCHTTSSWNGARFDHAAFTKFPLTGVHATLACAQCHVNARFAGTPADCASCHMKDFNNTTAPNHQTAGFPTDCSICHSTSGWAPASFDHAKVFPLTGVHATLACAACHVNNNFTSLGTTCVSCHLNDYNNTNNPNHKAAGFPTDCAVCHSTSAWTPASFDHSKTSFPLTGSHVNVPCASCHVNGRFAGTPTDCYSCHKPEYVGTTNPNHQAAQFPTTCNTCHNTVTWLGAIFNHTWFPIYSGTHAGKWMACTDCHVNTSNYAVFSCITCHAHDSSAVTPHHTDVSGYVYSATGCYSCHPTGQGGD